MLVGENAAWLGRDVSAQTVISTDFGFSVTTLLFIVDVSGPLPILPCSLATQ